MSLAHPPSSPRAATRHDRQPIGDRWRRVKLCALALIAVPAVAMAQPPATSWRGDVCHQQKRAAAAHGGLFGAVFGGLLGWTLSGREHRTESAVAAGAVGGAAGAAIGASSVQCVPYPGRVEAHEANCQWVNETDQGETRQFEVCRDPDGVWRPSGRS